MNIKLLVSSCAAVWFAAAASAASAPAPAARTPVTVSSSVTAVPLYKSTVVALSRPAGRVSVGNPGVADILVLRSRELYVVGKALGSTNVLVWDEAGNVFANLDVEVTHDLASLKDKLHLLLPGESINVQSAQEQLILSGQVSSASKADAAKTIATSFLPECIAAVSDAPVIASVPQKPAARVADANCKKGAVVNMLQVGGANQVMLRITVAEMARSIVRKLDANLNIMQFGKHLSGGAVNGGASFPDALDADGLLTPIFGGLDGSRGVIGPAVDGFSPNTPVIDGPGAFLSYLSGNTFVEAVIDVSKRRGLAKILSEPTLTTLTGQEAQFLSGGEFPVPVPQGGTFNSTTIEFKEFGVGVKFLPVVLDSGRINLAINVSVSELSSDNTVTLSSGGTNATYVIPSLTKRSAISTVELGDGQTIGIAGLMNDNMQEFVDKFPVLGDLPILGPLFRSQQFRSGQSELVIFVTPYLAKPISPQQVRLPTDGFVAPSDTDFYLLGRMSGTRRTKPAGAITAQRAPNTHFGHDPATQP